MNLILIDTNCLLSFVTDRNPRQANQVRELFLDADQQRSNLFICGNVLTEFVYVLTRLYEVPGGKAAKMSMDLLNSPGINFIPGYYPDELWKLWPTKVRDIGDAIVAATAKIENMKIATFDQKFRNACKKNAIGIHKFS